MIAELIDPAVLGIILVGVMLFAIFVGFPISFTLIFLGFVFGYLGFGKLVFYLMTLQFSMVMTEQTLAAVPLFVFMGIMMEQACSIIIPMKTKSGTAARVCSVMTIENCKVIK